MRHNMKSGRDEFIKAESKLDDIACFTYTAMEGVPFKCLKEIDDLNRLEEKLRESVVWDKEGNLYGANRGFAVSHSRNIASALHAGLLYWKVPEGFAPHAGETRCLYRNDCCFQSAGGGRLPV